MIELRQGKYLLDGKFVDLDELKAKGVEAKTLEEAYKGTMAYSILKAHNTFGIDVCCRYFVESDREEDFLDFLSSYELDPHEYLILGGGSNFLFTEDFPGTVFYPVMQGIELLSEDADTVRVRVGAGVVWDDFVLWCVGHGYGGVENLSLIPGHVGAAPVQNVGAYGMEAGETIEEVEAIDIKQACRVVLKS